MEEAKIRHEARFSTNKGEEDTYLGIEVYDVLSSKLTDESSPWIESRLGIPSTKLYYHTEIPGILVNSRFCGDYHRLTFKSGDLKDLEKLCLDAGIPRGTIFTYEKRVENVVKETKNLGE